MAVVECPCQPSVVSVETPLRAPFTGELLEKVRSLLDHGVRMIVVDVARLTTIDAGSIGELVSAYNEVVNADGAMRIVRVTPWVQEVLQTVGLFCLLSGRTDG